MTEEEFLKGLAKRMETMREGMYEILRKEGEAGLITETTDALRRIATKQYGISKEDAVTFVDFSLITIGAMTSLLLGKAVAEGVLEKTEQTVH